MSPMTNHPEGIAMRVIEKLKNIPRWINVVAVSLLSLLAAGLFMPLLKDAIVDRWYRGGEVYVVSHCNGPTGTVLQINNESNQDKYITRALFQVERVDEPGKQPCGADVPQILIRFFPSSKEPDSDYHQKTESFYIKTLDHKIDKFSRQNIRLKIIHDERTGWTYSGTLTIWFNDDVGQNGSLTRHGMLVLVGDED